FLYLYGLGPDVIPPYGIRRLRPLRVTDDLGRTLVFTYNHVGRCLPTTLCTGVLGYDFRATPAAEVLDSVSGPGGSTVQFEYDRPKNTPSDFAEMFLTSISRVDLPVGVDDVKQALPRSFTFYYQWPEGPVSSYDSYSQKVYDKYLQFYSTFVGCVFAPLSPCGERG